VDRVPTNNDILLLVRHGIIGTNGGMRRSWRPLVNVQANDEKNGSELCRKGREECGIKSEQISINRNERERHWTYTMYDGRERRRVVTSASKSWG